jgi:NCAIR mutase (PurE)-related protein
LDIEKLRDLLTQVQDGHLDIDQALGQLRALPYDDIGHARLDMHRALRQGLPEVVFCQNKTVEQATAILQRLGQNHDRVLATRVSADMANAIRSQIPDARYDPTSRLLTLIREELPPPPPDAPYAMVVSGGTSDLPVAEEAAQTAEFMGSRVERAYDVGVAGIHRLLDQRERLFNADVVISVAGMEGALTSVVGGLVSCPVVGVPTSIGYGAHFEGLASLLSMLNSCAPGVAVVNIDNGFGAGLYAHLILRRVQGCDQP